MLNTKPERPLPRIVAAIVGLAIVCLGLAPLLRGGDIFYTNWFGELVFAPLAIVSGIFTTGCAVFKPNWLAAGREAVHRKR
jgi:uncharacterized membrane protein